MHLVKIIWGVAKAFKSWMKIQPYILLKQRKDGKNQSLWVSYFKDWAEDGRIEFQFSDLAAPYILNTTKPLHVEIKRTLND